MDLTFAAYEGNLNQVKEMIRLGASVNAVDGCGDFPLYKANQIEIYKVLLENGANPNQQNRSGFTALMNARTAEQIGLLLENGANPNLRNEDGFTALMLHSYSGNIDMVRLLLENEADVTLRTNPPGSVSAFLQAMEEDNLEIMKLLVEYGVNLEEEDRAYESNTGETLLEAAISDETRSFIEACLK
ncbi:ankyrin repeat domain-containing protein [Leptospira stimsonii]|uniref:Uncharacterized protein n=1 Tax=Leptospira stimsonii TaxID=2202203 RepID=A0A396YQY1_9LEPT|nr:ankyrin repeat domain-containing protein [Leptospira stimsonii]RHX85632.1 hypothetical protein DLM75_20820 [Leptospira stimsonii]